MASPKSKSSSNTSFQKLLSAAAAAVVVILGLLFTNKSDGKQPPKPAPTPIPAPDSKPDGKPDSKPNKPNKPDATPTPTPAPDSTSGSDGGDGSGESTEAMRIHAIDIGQGAAMLLEFPCGAALVDTGGENSSYDSLPALQAYLDKFFARRKDLNRTLDLLLLTHPHIDHMRGVPLVLENYTVKNIVDNGQEGSKIIRSASNAINNYVSTNKNKVKRFDVFTAKVPDKKGFTNDIVDPISNKCGAGGAAKGPDPKITVLFGQVAFDMVSGDDHWMKESYGEREFDNENNHSVVTRVDFGESSIIITGDLEETAIPMFLQKYEGTNLVDTDVYVVGHHGSANGSTPELIQKMSPEYALINMGPPTRQENWTAWKFGHPRKKIIDMLLDNAPLKDRKAIEVQVAEKASKFVPMTLKKAIYATGWDGDVVLRGAADGKWRRLN